MTHGASPAEQLTVAAGAVEAVDRELRGVPGVRALLGDPQAALVIGDRVEQLTGRLDAIEAELDAGLGATLEPTELEQVNAALVRARDAVWAVGRDRLRTAREVGALAGPDPSIAALEGYLSVQVALSAIDRLEVRGRDSAGLHLLVRHHGLDLGEPAVRRLVDARATDPLFGSGSVRAVGAELAFVYKAAAEIGELGDNTAVLRAAIRDDELLQLALAGDAAEVMVLGHTRWASVGIISEANAHPLNQEELDGGDRPYVVGALNGDVDNYADLKALEHLQVPAEITTDAKVIPALVARRLATGTTVDDAFRTTVAELAGSMGIAAQTAAAPDQLLLSLRGSGQALYVGMVEDAFVVASEPYGLVEETATYLRMDGETPADPERASATRGQVVILDAARAGTLDGVRRFAFDGTPLPVTAAELQHAEITTRDIDRGDFPHFLLKEISEAPASFRKTLRGKVVDRDGRLTVALGADTLPDALRARLRSGAIRRVVVIGQGTAAIAGQSLATVLGRLADAELRTEALLATELSGFQLRDDMSDTLVIAISQSGTTTDTNRTSDLARSRGAAVVSIVNRRNSDLVDKSDGVLYTSDGRDVEMAVPSTKAFYAQIAAGYLLADRHRRRGDDARSRLRAPPARRAARSPGSDARGARAPGLDRRDRAAARGVAPVLGGGRQRAQPHRRRRGADQGVGALLQVDLVRRHRGQEAHRPLGRAADHRVRRRARGIQRRRRREGDRDLPRPPRRADRDRQRGRAPLRRRARDHRGARRAPRRRVRAVGHGRAPLRLRGGAGHRPSARPLRESRAAVQATVSGARAGADLLVRLAPELEVPAATFLDGLRVGSYDGHLEAGTAVRITSLLRYATGLMPLDVYQVEHGAVGTPSRVVEDLTAALTKGIEELTRPVDAIKHQAKTVTVGISRSDEELLQVALAREVLAAGAARDALSYRALRTLVALDPAVEQIVGFTRYRIEGDFEADEATIHVVDRGGISVDLRSRTDDDPRLVGSKHRVATQREVTVVRGARDQRTVIIVPEVKDNETVGLTLLQARFVSRVPADVARTVLQGYQGRYGALRDAVTETAPTFDDSRLATVDLIDLLTVPVNVLAEHWR